MRKVRSFIPHGTILKRIFILGMTDSNYVNKRTIHLVGWVGGPTDYLVTLNLSWGWVEAVTIIMLYRYQYIYWGGERGGGSGDPYFFLHISSSWVKIRLQIENQLPGLSGSALKVWLTWVGGVVVQLITLSLSTWVEVELRLWQFFTYSVQTNWKGLKGRLVDRQTNNLTYW
jgi:hypothetical protein